MSRTPKYSKPQPNILDLFPEIHPYDFGHLAVDDLHHIYWEESGNPAGIPIVMLHGGPGAGASSLHRRFFDPDFYRIIIFDQRGAGRSNPIGCVERNTTDLLVQDIEALRKHLNVERWHVFGGSWGSTLALAYASKYAERCVSLILRGIFLCESYEVEWFLHGMRTIFPEAWEQLTGLLDKDERSDILGSYYKRLTCGDIEREIEAATHWSLYENACSSLLPNYEIITSEKQKKHSLAISRIEAHYFLHELRDGEKSLLKQVDQFRHIPATIVQGRYDVICPIRTAYKLHQLWPEARYNVVPDAGHSAMDPPLRSALIHATEDAKTIPY